MFIKSKVARSTLYIILNGELDENSALHTRKTLDGLFEREKFNQVVMDLSELEFMDSTGIGVFVGRYKVLKNMGVPLFITSPTTQVDKVLKMSGIYQIVKKIDFGGKNERA